MENRFVAARRQAMWRVLQSRRLSEKEKLDALADMAEREGRQAYGRGLRATRVPMATPRSAIKAGKLRPVERHVRADVDVIDVDDVDTTGEA
jgi:hypothetical protein